jgi:hypothetical protein
VRCELRSNSFDAGTVEANRPGVSELSETPRWKLILSAPDQMITGSQRSFVPDEPPESLPELDSIIYRTFPWLALHLIA